jgi:hypothetical protein
MERDERKGVERCGSGRGERERVREGMIGRV